MDLPSAILSGLLNLASLVCLIVLLVHLAREKGAGHGLLGFLFPPYAFFWGWLNAGRLQILDIMAFWTAVMILAAGFPMLMSMAALQGVSLSP